MSTTSPSRRAPRRQRRSVAIAAIVALVAVAAACGSDADSGSPTSDAPASSSSPTSAPTDSSAPGGPDTTSSSATPGETTPSTAATESGTRIISTVYGDVEVPVAPQRVVAISYDTPWQLQAVGITPVAVQDYGKWIDQFSADQQEFVKGLTTIGVYGQINLEAVAATNPDLIVGDQYEVDEATFETLSDIAPTVIVTAEARGDWKTISSQVADAAGGGEDVAALQQQYESELTRITADYVDELALQWAHFSLGDSDGEFSVQYPTGATGDLIFNDIGATWASSVPAGEPLSGYESFSLEQIADVLGDAEVLVHFLNADGSPNPSIQAVIDTPFFQALAATQAGHVYGLTTSVTDYATALDYLAELEAKVLKPLAG